ncbi:MAG TPA: hypothetical protein VJV78_38535 [Polyangiales bacterium]|nr:hypothetical protein [Polyangiales bacterium]
MIWRLDDQQILAADGDSFVLIGSNGEVSSRYDPSNDGYDDGFLRVDYLVDGSRFLSRTVRDEFGVIKKTRDRVVLTGLRPADEAATRALVDVALAEESARAAQAAAREKQEDEARVRAIDGALDDFGLGADFARAQAALVKYVRTSAHFPHPELLRTLVYVARARPPAPVLTAFTRSCLKACSQDKLPAPVPGPPAKLPALAAELRARERDLRLAVEIANDIDANQAASKYERAADEMLEAVRLAE